MKAIRWALGAPVLWMSVCAPAQTIAPSGEVLYRGYCGNCHGARAEGARGPALAGARLPRASTAALFTQIVQQGIPNTEMPPSRLQEAETARIFEFLKGLGAPGAGTDAKAAARGEQVFRGKGDCLRCHMVYGEGGRMGPELSAIGLHTGAARLRAAVLYPEEQTPDNFAQYRLVIPVPDNFLMVHLRTRDGREIRGIRMDEDPFTIQVRDLNDRLYSFAKADLTELVREKRKSPMPSYQGRLSETELDDLVAYLLSLRGAR